jgi:hypothetical protein
VSFAPKFVYIPPPSDDEITRTLGPSLLMVAEAVIQEVEDSTTFKRRKAFIKEAYTELNEDGEQLTAEAGTRWKLAHIFEFGSVFTMPGGHLRKAAEVVANKIGRYEP